jgi:YjbE family integral membrane protein
LGGIVLVDLALSGDNALVIGAAAAGIPRRQQRLAILLGGGGAIVLRIALGIVAVLLLQLPLLQAIGGAVLLVVAWRLLAGHLSGAPIESSAQGAQTHGEPPPPRRRSGSLGSALVTILVADATMSLDNVLAVGALSHGNLPLLAGGLLLSMAILLLGSALVARLLERLPWLVDVAALVLAWTAAQLVLHDPRVAPAFGDIPWPQVVVPAAAFALVMAVDLFLRVREFRRKRKASSM